MALSFLKDRDENEVLGNLGAFTRGGAGGHSVQTALEIYRKDQKSHHEQSIASDLTRGLLRKIFRDTVLESSKQVKRKYSYSAVGSTVQEDIDAANMGIMAKLKKLQKERLIVARLGFPDKAMEIDEHIEKIRADLRSEREKVDSRILKEELANLALQHREKLSALDLELKEDENKVRSAFELERSTILAKQEKQFVQLVDDAIKRAIGKSKSCSCAKKYLCHHNKTASFNTRRPKKEVIHFRKNAKRLRHGGRLEESAAWEEKAAELDADHLDKWREEVAANLTASAWGGSSSALDQLASQHQREITRMEMAQANEWTLMLMRHRTARRNCHNAIMVEQKKLRVACKKSAEERHRREMLGEADPLEGGAAASGGPDENVAGMLRNAIDDDDDDEGSTTDDNGQGRAQENPANNAVATTRPPTRPSSAPPARGRRPQLNTSNNAGNQQASRPSAAASAAAGGGVTNGVEGADVDDDSFGKDSHDLVGFDELEGEAAGMFSYDDYPAAGSPEEPEWFHTPWCGTNSGDVPVLDKVFEKAPVGGDAPTVAQLNPRESTPAPSALSDMGVSGRLEDGSSFVKHRDAGGSSTKIEEIASSHPPRREGQHRGSGDVKPGATIELVPVARGAGINGVVVAVSSLSIAGGEEKEEGRRRPRRESGGVSSPRAIAGGGELKRYDWGGADAVPTKPSLAATSKIPTGNRAAKQRFRNAKRKEASKKTVSWGDNVEVPPESDDDEDGTDNDEDDNVGGDSERLGRNDADASNLDAIADGFVDDDFLRSDDDDSDDDERGHNKDERVIGQTKESSRLDHLEELACESAAPSKWTAARASDTDEKVFDRETDRKGREFSKSVHSDDHNESVARAKNDGRPEERETFDVDTVPARGKKRALSVEERPSATEEGSSPQEISGSNQNCMEQPLQHALDQFCLIHALHGDWLSLLGQIVGDEVGRKALHRWSSEHHWREHVEECYTADLAWGADGRVLSWGSARATAAAETVASSAILARFVASPAAWRMVHGSKAGRKSIGGRTIAEEPALARSRRPWRTLFERVLGSLQYGAVLSLIETTRDGIGRGRRGASNGVEAAAAAGKVLWANEGFEKLAGVDAVDVVGQQICSLFEEGEGEEGDGGEEGEHGELKRSLELGKNCMLWMTMAGQQDGFTDVLCLHQTVAVPPQLSDEGSYSVLLFFDTASVLLEDQDHGGRGWGGQVEGQGGGSVMQPDREEGDGLGQEGEDKHRERRRRQVCHDLSEAMTILLNDGLVDVKGELAEEKGDRSFIDSRQSENPINGRNSSRNPPVSDGTRRLEGQNAEREARHNGYGAEGGGAEGEGDPEQRRSALERPSLLGLNREADALSRDLQGDLDGELLEVRLARECGIVNELRGDSFEKLPLSDVPRTDGGGGQSEEEESNAITRTIEQHQHPVRPTSTSHSAAENDTAEYSSGDDSSVPPRVDLLLSPYRASTSTRSALPTDEQQTPGKTARIPHRGSSSSSNGTAIDETLVTTSRIPPATDSRVADPGRSYEEVENSTATGENLDDEQGRNQQDTLLPGTADPGKAPATAKYDDATQPPTATKLRLSLDGYEDDFCDDEDESASLVQPEAEGEGITGMSSDTTVGNDSNNKLEGKENRSDMIRDGTGDDVAGGFDHDDDDYTADGYASPTSDGVYSDTAAGGLEDDLHGDGRSNGVGYGHDGNFDASWGGSPEGGLLGEGDVWGIRSPPRSSGSNHRDFSSRNDGRRTVHHGHDTQPLASEETDRRVFSGGWRSN